MFVLKYGELVLRNRERLRALRARDFAMPGVKRTRELLYQHAPQQEHADKLRRSLVQVSAGEGGPHDDSQAGWAECEEADADCTTVAAPPAAQLFETLSRRYASETSRQAEDKVDQRDRERRRSSSSGAGEEWEGEGEMQEEAGAKGDEATREAAAMAEVGLAMGTVEAEKPVSLLSDERRCSREADAMVLSPVRGKRRKREERRREQGKDGPEKEEKREDATAATAPEEEGAEDDDLVRRRSKKAEGVWGGSEAGQKRQQEKEEEEEHGAEGKGRRAQQQQQEHRSRPWSADFSDRGFEPSTAARPPQGRKRKETVSGR